MSNNWVPYVVMMVGVTMGFALYRQYTDSEQLARTIAACREDSSRAIRPPQVLDVRSDTEAQALPYAGAVKVPSGRLIREMEGLLPDKSRPILVLASSEMQKQQALRALRSMGYRHVDILEAAKSPVRTPGCPEVLPTDEK